MKQIKTCSQKHCFATLILTALCFYTITTPRLNAEVLEYLYTTTAVFDGAPGVNGLNGGTAYTMPAGDNSYVGWIWFPYGFTIPSASTAYLNVLPRVNGTIDLNDATLTITGDLHLASDASFATNDGTIYGENQAIILSDDLDLDAKLTFESDTIIEGNNNELSLNTNGNLLIKDGVTLTLQNLVLKNLSNDDEGRIIMEGQHSVLELDNVTLWLSGDYSFLDGHIYFYNDVTISGSPYQFSYESDEISYITKQAKLTIDHGVTFNYVPATSSSKELIVMNDATSHLYLKNCKLHTKDIGFHLKTGTIVFDSLVTLSADGQTASTGIILGGAGADEITGIGEPGAGIEVYGYVDVT